SGPLIAIRTRLISRKSMGGMLTDLHSRVLDARGEPLPGLYAAGEAAGFGGGGISGIRSLEGTFLSNCILNGRRAAQTIAGDA
ncbi:fumarate reductase/succinate dehydrogenase flavoprotein domain-containing protein, partial [Stutzerimonas stutzeri TS44]